MIDGEAELEERKERNLGETDAAQSYRPSVGSSSPSHFSHSLVNTVGGEETGRDEEAGVTGGEGYARDTRTERECYPLDLSLGINSLHSPFPLCLSRSPSLRYGTSPAIDGVGMI